MSASNGAVEVPTTSSARALTAVSVDASPGVSTTVRSRSFSLVRVTSTYATRAAGHAEPLRDHAVLVERQAVAPAVAAAPRSPGRPARSGTG